VLSIEHTLANSARFLEVDSDAEQLLKQRQLSESTAKLHDGFLQELLRFESLGMWTKLRPGVREFLRRANEKFELWVHTASSRSHANAILDVLDPSDSYFGGRVIVKSEGLTTTGEQNNMLLQALEERRSVTVVLDEQSSTWPLDIRNLLVMERYHFFPASRRRYGLKGRSLLEINRLVLLRNILSIDEQEILAKSVH
jgi:RNA polymerase II C-terminal domain phosphatase-like 3/4